MKNVTFVLYCTVLYCSIDVFGCDCCRKLCGKSGEEGVQEEEGKWLKKKTEWEFLESEEYNTQEKRADVWAKSLTMSGYQDDDVVPVVFKRHDKKKGCVLPGNSEEEMIAIPNDMNVLTMYNTIFEGTKIKSFVLYFNGDTNQKYDGTQTTLGEKLISDKDLLFNKESEDPILKRAVFISYYAEMDNKNILV